MFFLCCVYPSPLPFPSHHHHHQAAGTYKDMSQWISKKSVPLVGQRTKDNMALKYDNKPLVVVYYDVNFTHQYIKGKLCGGVLWWWWVLCVVVVVVYV